MKKYCSFLIVYLIFFDFSNAAEIRYASVCPRNESSAPIAGFASSDTSFCGKKKVDFFDRSTNNPTSWQWFFEGAVPGTSTLQNPAGIYYPTHGSFDVKLIACNAEGCDTILLADFIHENRAVHMPLITVSNDTLMCTDAYSYQCQWYYNSIPIQGAVLNYHVYRQPGSYTVSIRDSIGCAAASSVFFAAIDEIPTGSWKIHVVPNPSDGQFEITYRGFMNHPVVFEIYDVTGRNIFNAVLPGMGSGTSIDLSYAINGIYFLRVKTGLEIWNKKILINHMQN